MNHHDSDHAESQFDLGLQKDLAMWERSSLDRRRALKLGLAGLTALLGASQLGQNAQAANGCVARIPSETAGPFPADGSQQISVLNRAGIVRSDIRTSLSSKKTAAGTPLTLELTLVDSSKNCAPLAGYAVYLWHCTGDGKYSMYSSGVTDEDFLRGVQASDKNGKLVFKTIFPGCYPGRWPHAHFEVYPSLAKATNAANIVHTSQLALPETACRAVYSNSKNYPGSTSNLGRLSLATDGIFRDGADSQMVAITGDATKGYVAKLTIGV